MTIDEVVREFEKTFTIPDSKGTVWLGYSAPNIEDVKSFIRTAYQKCQEAERERMQNEIQKLSDSIKNEGTQSETVAREMIWLFMQIVTKSNKLATLTQPEDTKERRKRE